MSDCSSTQEKLNALLDRELSVIEWLRVRRHLATCADCRKRLAEYRSLSMASRQVRSIPTPTKWVRFVPAASLGLVVLAFCFWISTRPKQKEPMALVFDQAALTGELRPTSALYAEGANLVLRDPKSGLILASSPGHTRRDAFNAISIANNVPNSQPEEVHFEVARPYPNIDPQEPLDIVVMEDKKFTIKEDNPVVVFFMGDPSELKGLNLPKKGPAFFVKIIDPKFFEEMSDAQPVKKLDIPLNKKPSAVNR